MPEFSRTAKRRHTFAFVSTPLPAPFSPFSFDTTAANRSDPLFFFLFFLLFSSFPFSSMPTRVERGNDTVRGSPSIRWKRVFPPDIGWLCGWNLSTDDQCARQCAGPRSITTPALSSLFSRPWVLTRGADARKYGIEFFFRDLQRDLECLPRMFICV